MNPSQLHALADDHHQTLIDVTSASQAPDLERPRWVQSRRRLGVLLVEAGLHLITTSDRPRRTLTLAR